MRLKENDCGCAGVFNTNSIQLLTQIFENNNCLDMLENFVSINGPLHYEKKKNLETITLKSKTNQLVTMNILS